MNRLKEKFASVIICSVFLVVVIFGTSASAFAKQKELNVAFFGPATHVVTTEAVSPWISSIEKQSNGELKLNLFPGGTLVSAADTWQAIESGLVDIGIGYVGYTPGRFSLSEVMSLPFLNIPNAVTGSKILWRLYNEDTEVSSQYSGAKILFLYTNSPAQIHTTRKPIVTYDDIKGMTVRCPGSIAPIFTAIGASPAVMGAASAYESLERNVVDSTTFPWEALKSYKISEVTKYHTILNHYVGPYFVAMNKDVWNNLPQNLKSVFDSTCGEKAAVLFGAAYDKADSWGLDLVMKDGHQIISLTQSERDKFVQGSRQVWDEWVQTQNKKSLNGKEVLDKTIKLVSEYTE